MKSPDISDPDEVLDSLGEKVTTGLATAVKHTARDLAEYRAEKPEWVAGHSPRGLSNWIADRLWVRALAVFDEIADVDMREAGATREVWVRGTFRFRLKRHHIIDDAVSTYPTITAMEFLAQPAGQLPGMETVHLIAGYVWDKSTNEMGSQAVISLRDGKDNVIWSVLLPEVDEEGNLVPLPAADGGPEAPTIELGGVDERVSDGDG